MTMKTLKNRMNLGGLALAALLSAASAAAPMRSPAQDALADIEKTFGFVPQFFRDFPESALSGTWEEMKALQMNPGTALSGKHKELIGLAVAAQIPCQFCIEAHADFARLNGASEKEIGEAVAVAGLTRHWSTFINGTLPDEKQFRSDIGKSIDHIKKGPQPNQAPVAVVDGASALKDIQQTFGMVPDFLRKFPDQSRAAAWKAMKDVELAPGALAGKHKSMIGIAVASQIPCRFCLIADMEFAKLDGATEAEINEAIAMAAFTRQMSTFLNGMQVDLPQFRADLSRLVKGAQAAAAASKDKKPSIPKDSKVTFGNHGRGSAF
jgi:AhpD family alkylhydroperoxidase